MMKKLSTLAMTILNKTDKSLHFSILINQSLEIMKHVVCRNVPQKFVAYYLSKGGYNESDLVLKKLPRKKFALVGPTAEYIGE